VALVAADDINNLTWELYMLSEGKCDNCNTAYSLKENEADDGYCCFECWEEANCLEPEEFHVSVEA